MAVSTSTSFILSSVCSIIVFGLMQLLKSQIVESKLFTIFGGFLGSILFLLLVIACGNFETMSFGNGFQTKLVPEVVMCLAIALFASSLVHRICVTVCFLFAMVHLYYMNKISLKLYNITLQTKKGK